MTFTPTLTRVARDDFTHFARAGIGWLAVALLLGACADQSVMDAGPLAPAMASTPQFGQIETLALVPAVPGFPEGISIDGTRIYVSGPAIAGTAGTGPSKIYVFKRSSGGLESEVLVGGENQAFEHAFSANALDSNGRIVVLTAQLFAPPSAQLGLLRFSKMGNRYRQEIYSDPFPNLSTCAFGPLPVSCALPNDMAFAEDGSAYVTDSFQAAIWRVPPGGGMPQVWLQNPLLAGSGALPIGVNGIRLDPARQYVYFTVTFSAADFNVGAVYRVPFAAQPDPSLIELVHEYNMGEGPDGLAFGASGRLYVALAAANAISVLDNGVEVARITSPPGSAIPLDGPANIAFDDNRHSLLVTNHASLSGNEANFAVLRIFVDDVASPLVRPILP
ncbi:MAG: SMP-30/gluconolactonase/LRE family protein [Gemmatimonadetes bacterium]|nr:SMP-30/gluconolactonase/LRE family protein [Gemmatimonadota bacterium]